jgi:hypothetical protein
MNDRPDARNLLESARNAFLADILPALPEASRYTALMIANAMAIAQREIAAGDAALRAECERLRRLLSESAAAPAGDALRVALGGYNRRLAREIRAGRFDGEGRAGMLEHLRRTTEEKLAVSNPKALAGQGSLPLVKNKNWPQINADKR